MLSTLLLESTHGVADTHDTNVLLPGHMQIQHVALLATRCHAAPCKADQPSIQGLATDPRFAPFQNGKAKVEKKKIPKYQ